MSAFITSKDTVDLLTTAAMVVTGTLGQPTNDTADTTAVSTADQTGQMLVDANFELRLKLPDSDGRVQVVDLTARCLWCHEDVTPRYYDAGFTLYQPPPEYTALITALRQYFSFYPLPASA